MTDVIYTENLTKHYGKVHAVEGVNLQIGKAEIYGFLGLNGAGKTTTIRMLLGMIRATGGSAFVFGQKVGPGNTDLWNQVGHLVETPLAYPELTVLENLKIYYRLRFLKDPGLLTEVIEKLHLVPYKYVKAKHLSLGNAQRLGIAKAMIHKPSLLILDEPANGLDPEGIVETREMLSDLAGNRGVTIFISSHILGEISRFATRIGIIHEGRMIHESEVDRLDKSRHRSLHVDTLDNKRAFEILTFAGYAAENLYDGSLEVKGKAAIEYPEKISALLAAQGLAPKKLMVEEEDLEHFFLRFIKNSTPSS